MRYSLVKAATIALLGLQDFISHINAFPTGGVDHVGDTSVTKLPHVLAPRAKPVPRLEYYKYEAQHGFAFPWRPVRYVILKDGVGGYVDEIIIDKTWGIITVEKASNQDDRTDNKLRLSDIAMSLFVHYGEKRPSDLVQVVFSNVVENSQQLHEVLEKALLDAGWHQENPVTVTATPTSLPFVESTQKRLFATIEDQPFAKSVRWMATDFGVPLVTSWTVSGSTTRPILTASFRETGSGLYFYSNSCLKYPSSHSLHRCLT
ncbi:hypothetical protein BKA64DRAFT_669722 [Cadophora sp. MPI-SDFR-AT-0126]|nr:hypothetical protein BKA64DRAFT_669722 [Leotiomycetes sp. MPI-SDFR-AT-0126]